MSSAEVVHWEIDLAATGGGVTRLQAAPDSCLVPVEKDVWVVQGEYATFSIGRPGTGCILPAGWYELSMRLAAQGDSALAPHLLVRYASGADGEAEISLPPSSTDGELRTLVLFKYDVVGLYFAPGFGRVRFSLQRPALKRLTRARSLLIMLGSSVAGRRVAQERLQLTFRFMTAMVRHGVRAAASELFDSYRRRGDVPTVAPYLAWVARYDTLSAGDIEHMRARAGRLVQTGPLISVLVPIYQTPEKWLRACIESVLTQVYPKWELCLVDDASPDLDAYQVAVSYAEGDDRIRVIRRATNGHISRASNSALEMAGGEFVALLDHDDELRPHALLEIVEELVAQPQALVVYSDEDKLDSDGRRFDPYFKPDWNPDLLLAQNYLCHLSVIATELVREVGGFRPGYEGSQDHDLVLRCTERLQRNQIRHVPKVLYHWRAIPGSTALSRDAKDYAADAGARAVASHLERRERGAKVRQLSHGHYRVEWPLPDPQPRVSLVIPTRDKVHLLRKCVESILGLSTYSNFELLIVDNGSADPEALGYLAELGRHPAVRVCHYDRPFNYSAINNWAVRQASGEVIGLVNNDIEVINPGWLEELVAQAMRPGIGAVGAMLYFPDETIQHAGVITGIHGIAGHIYGGLPKTFPGHGGRARVAQELSAVTGACLFVRRSVYEQVGGLDERLEVAFNDIDFCLRLGAAGYRNIWTPFAELYHHESASRGSEDTEEKKRRFEREVELMMARWGGSLRRDPAYNPNLSLTSCHSTLASPPRTSGMGQV